MSKQIVKHTKAKELPDSEFLHECFDYNPETGELFWKVERPASHFKNTHGMRIHNSKWGGKRAGTLVGGRIVVRLFAKVHFLIHLVIWKMFRGDTDGFQVDHEDKNALNNRLDNLRLSTNQANNANTGRKTYMGKTRHLPKGVYPNGKNKWQAKIKVNYKTHCLGTYDSPEKASKAYFEAAKKFFGEFACQD